MKSPKNKHKHEHEIPCTKCDTKPWYREKLFIITIILVVALVVSYAIPTLNPFFYAVAD